jgi:hypothetical protein
MIAFARFSKPISLFIFVASHQEKQYSETSQHRRENRYANLSNDPLDKQACQASAYGAEQRGYQCYYEHSIHLHDF